MGLKNSLLWRLGVPLVFWAIIIVVILLLPPAPEESDDLSSEAWSYYDNGAPLSRQLVKYRTEVLLIVVMCAVGTEVGLFLFEKKKRMV